MAEVKKGRPATGTLTWCEPRKDQEQGHYAVRLTLADGTRPWIHLDPSPRSKQAEARAREKAAAWAERVAREQIVSVSDVRPAASAAEPSAGETVRQYAKRWLAERERRGLASVATDRGRLDNHVLPVIGDRPLAEVTRDELRAVVAALDAKSASGAFSWRTAVRCWGLVTKLFSDAVDSKRADLRSRTDNPCAGLPGPDSGVEKGKQWLYPSEVGALLACDAVPTRWRRLYALAAYLYLRPGELAALEWADVHAGLGYLSIHQALDLRTGEVGPTKTKHTRKVPIRPALVPLLDAIRAETGGEGRVVQHDHANKDAQHGFPPLEDLAATLRAHLKRAGVDRADLHEDRATTKRLTFYDLRATGITWEVLDGTEHVRIMQRAGHRNFSTTQGYIREAEAVGVNVGRPFAPLPPSVLGGAGGGTFVPDFRPEEPARESGARNDSQSLASPTGFEPVLQP